MAKIIVGMSGGVDSAVTAKILKDQGHEVIGIFMRNWDSTINNDFLGNPNIKSPSCPEERDWKDVQKICNQIGIKCSRIDFVKEYWNEVFCDLITQYEKGRTPNPDILCNRYIKFGHFYDWVEKSYHDFDFIATGHYANIENNVLKKPYDKWKDQTYFLSQIKKEKLKKILFPLANISKNQVREIAKKNNLVVMNKKDSTGICFIGERNFTQFLQNYIPSQPGNIVNIKNKKIIGKHIGAMYYTIGQRKGLNLGGMKEPFYVSGHDIKNKIIFVAPQSDKSYLTSNKSIITKINWFWDNKKDLKNLKVKFRYNSKSINCSINWINNDTLEVHYPSGFEAVTPGQQAVFYKKDYCLGGGIIDKVYDANGLKKYL